MAAIIDTVIGLLGLGVFLLVFHLAGYEFNWNKQTFPIVGSAAVLIAFLYRLLFCLGNGDSIGLLLTDLRLVDFYGRIPKRRDRLYRLAGGCLSCISIGMGLLWAICDEEHLTWHDHMSKTYPTMAHRAPQPVSE
jgi:RDD family